MGDFQVLYCQQGISFLSYKIERKKISVMIYWMRAQSDFKDLLLGGYNLKADVLMQKSKKMIWNVKEVKCYLNKAEKWNIDSRK